MILEAANGPLVYRQRARRVADSYGDDVGTWDAPEETLLVRAQVQADKLMRTSETETPSSDESKTQGHLYYSGKVEILETDRIRYGADVWRVEGMPITRYGLGSGSYTHAKLSRSVSNQE